MEQGNFGDILQAKQYLEAQKEVIQQGKSKELIKEEARLLT